MIKAEGSLAGVSPCTSIISGRPLTASTFASKLFILRKLHCVFGLNSNRTIDPPSPRLLAIHRAIGRILHLSGAGVYVERLLRDVDGMDIQEDGSTHIGYLVRLQ